MIFSDQKTAKEVRAEAERQLIEWLYEQNKSLLSAVGLTRKLIEGDITHESLHNNAESAIRRGLPPLVATLLYKSGIIHAKSESDEVNSVILYYDNDSDNDDYRVTKAMDEISGRLIGGLFEGRIHT